MNKFTENECLPNFELKFKSLENLSKPPTRKITRKRIVECEFTNSSGRKTIIQVLRDDFDPLEISYLRAAWPRQSGIHIQLQPQSSGKTAAYIE